MSARACDPTWVVQCYPVAVPQRGVTGTPPQLWSRDRLLLPHGFEGGIRAVSLPLGRGLDPPILTPARYHVLLTETCYLSSEGGIWDGWRVDHNTHLPVLSFCGVARLLPRVASSILRMLRTYPFLASHSGGNGAVTSYVPAVNYV